VSTDSGRSDIWSFNRGVFDAEKRAYTNSIEVGVITVTSPVINAEDGFTNDGVVLSDSSDGWESGAIRVSSTTDEGIQSTEASMGGLYGDDKVWVLGGESMIEYGGERCWEADEGLLANGRPSIASTPVYENLDQAHGGPSIAYALGIDQDTDENNGQIAIDHVIDGDTIGIGSRPCDEGMGGGAQDFDLQIRSGNHVKDGMVGGTWC